MLRQYDHDVHPVGEGLPASSVRVYRVRAVTAFLQSGVALNKLDCFRELLKENCLSLSSSQHLKELIPLVLREERRKIKEQIHDRQVSVIFDGTTHVAEAISLDASHAFPFLCLTDFICNTITLFFKDSGSLQASQKRLLCDTLRFSSGYCFTRSDGTTVLPLLLFNPVGEGLLATFLFLAKSEAVGHFSLLCSEGTAELEHSLAALPLELSMTCALRTKVRLIGCF